VRPQSAPHLTHGNSTSASFAKHRTITALEHARALKVLRGERRGVQIEVEQRSLAVYDALLA
jgi:hypothetical protein